MKIDQKTAIDTAELFRSLSDPTRVKLMAGLLDSELNVNQLAQTAGISASAASHQLRILRQMRIVRTRRAGREIFYRLDDIHVAELFQRGVTHIQHG